MSDDIVQRLRAEHCDTSQCPLCRLLRSAAAEIERLRAENARSLKEAKHTARRIGEAHRQIDGLRSENLRLATDNGMLRQDLAETRDLYDQHRQGNTKLALKLADTSHALGRAQALISWIDGACTDQRPPADIEAAITRWKDEQC